MKSKKFLKSGIVCIFAALILLPAFLTSCPTDSSDDITVESFFVKPPNQTAIFLGDGVAELNLKGMVVWANFSNGVTEKVSIDNDDIKIEIEKEGNTYTANIDGTKVTFTVTSEGFTIGYSGIEFNVTGFDLTPGPKDITVSYGSLEVATFKITIVANNGDIIADIGYQKGPVFAGEVATVRYPIKMIKTRPAGTVLALKWFDKDGKEISGGIGIIDEYESNDDELVITTDATAKVGKYSFELGYISLKEEWIVVSVRADLILSKLPDLANTTFMKLSAKWYETQAKANNGGADYLIELTSDAKVVVPALGTPAPTIGTWDLNTSNKRITITGIGGYALFGTAVIYYEFDGNTKIHVTSDSPITGLLGLNEADLYKKP